MPEEHKLQYHSFDMSKHSKKNLDVITPLQKIASNSIDRIGFFHNGTDLASTKVQKGIIRTNCIDCLDRTNAAVVYNLQRSAFVSIEEPQHHFTESTNLDYQIF